MKRATRTKRRALKKRTRRARRHRGGGGAGGSNAGGNGFAVESRGNGGAGGAGSAGVAVERAGSARVTRITTDAEALAVLQNYSGYITGDTDIKNIKGLFFTRTFEEDGAEVIAQTFPFLKSLEKLVIAPSRDLGRSKIGDTGARYIAEALPELTTLTLLALVGTNIGDAGAIHLAAALPSLTALTRLDLADNNISDDGIKAIIEVLRYDLPALTSLDLRSNLKGTNIERIGPTIRVVLNERNKDPTLSTITDYDIKLGPSILKF